MLFRYLKNTAFGFCPNCGVGEIFFSWSRMKDNCSNCGVRFIEKQGDQWFFLLFIDRGLFIFPIIVGYYFGLSPKMLIVLSIFLLVIFLIATPFRLGLSLAFDYFMRTKIRKD
ncbi:MAG: hypothetical protein ACJZ12_05475 [Candidatus Neomarinimicrobiota bacterium]